MINIFKIISLSILFCTTVISSSHAKVDENDALCQCIYQMDDSCVQYYLTRGIDINKRCYDKDSFWTRRPVFALFLAVEQENVNLINQLLEKGANINLDDGRCLYMLVDKGNKKMAEFLLSKNANPNLVYSSYPLLSVAVENSDIEMMSLLLKYKANINAESGHAIRFASKKGLTQPVKLLISEGANVNLKDDKGNTALMNAAENGHLEIVSELLANGANPNIINDDKYSALMLAAKNGYESIVRKLLENGAEPKMFGLSLCPTN